MPLYFTERFVGIRRASNEKMIKSMVRKIDENFDWQNIEKNDVKEDLDVKGIKKSKGRTREASNPGPDGGEGEQRRAKKIIPIQQINLTQLEKMGITLSTMEPTPREYANTSWVKNKWRHGKRFTLTPGKLVCGSNDLGGKVPPAGAAIRANEGVRLVEAQIETDCF